jgi:hypothetical protein
MAILSAFEVSHNVDGKDCYARLYDLCFLPAHLVLKSHLQGLNNPQEKLSL